MSTEAKVETAKENETTKEMAKLTPKDQIVIGVIQTLELLDNGFTREDIGEHYGITQAEVKELFMHPKLKGKKTKKKPRFVIVDDASAEAIGLPDTAPKTVSENETPVTNEEDNKAAVIEESKEEGEPKKAW